MADKAVDKTADQQKVGEVLKDFAANVTSSKTKERCRILAQLERCVLENGKALKPAFTTDQHYLGQVKNS